MERMDLVLNAGDGASLARGVADGDYNCRIMSNALFERLLSSKTMLEAEKELLASGVAAVPVLASILDGTAKNGFGVAYRDLGLPLRCAIEVAGRLGPQAKPLEGLLAQELLRGSPPAANALGHLRSLEASSVQALAACLDSRDGDLAVESAAALIRCNEADHAAVVHATIQSAWAAKHIALMQRHAQAHAGLAR